ncbi:MAG: hypothetical protein U0234_10135 [Sandaracinus sp.]
MAEDPSTSVELVKAPAVVPLEVVAGSAAPPTGANGVAAKAEKSANETSGEHPLEALEAPKPVPAPDAAAAVVEAPAAPAPVVEAAPEAAPAPETRSATLRRSRSALENVRGGLREAGRRLDDEARLWDAQAEAAALPAIGNEAPLATLAARVDRESAYWRSFAVRNLRPGAARNIAIAGAALALTAGLALGLLATLATLLGSGTVAAGALWAAGGVTTCALVATMLGVLSERGRVMAAREALARADHAERRLERIVAILALEDVSGAKYADALARLERER